MYLINSTDVKLFSEKVKKTDFKTRRADNLITFVCRFSRKPGSLNILEPSGPVQACIGVALP
jgi:hypothetical protein